MEIKRASPVNSQGWGKTLADWFFPRYCLVSGVPLGTPDHRYHYLSDASASRIIRVKPPHCPICGHPFWGAASEDQTCSHCLDLEPWFRQGKTAALMRGPARQLILELKYRRGLYVLPDLRRLAQEAEGFLPYLENAVLVPVPLHASKLRSRGFNQSEWIAKMLVSETASSRVENLLWRVRKTETQTRLRRQDRQKNMADAFQLRSRVRVHPEVRYVLIDDVFTTGATLNACAKVLVQGGADQVDIATLCHG